MCSSATARSRVASYTSIWVSSRSAARKAALSVRSSRIRDKRARAIGWSTTVKCTADTVSAGPGCEPAEPVACDAVAPADVDSWPAPCHSRTSAGRGTAGRPAAQRVIDRHAPGVAGLRDDGRVEVLNSRVLLRPTDPARSQAFYREVLGLAVYREFGPPEEPGLVFFTGNGLLEVSGRSDGPVGGMALWLQVRDVAAEVARLAAAGVPILREPLLEPWGLVEAWLADPDGVRLVLVEVPADHPLRRDRR